MSEADLNTAALTSLLVLLWACVLWLRAYLGQGEQDDV